MFKDEEIVKERYLKRKEKYTGIDTGIYSGGEFYEFSKIKLFCDKVGVILPTAFEDMSDDEAKKKYPSQERPHIIKTNRSGTINFAFSLIDECIDIEQLEMVSSDFLRVMKRLYPTNICLKQEAYKGEDLSYASVEFTSIAIDDNLYNMVIFCIIGKQLLLFLFNCPYNNRTDWSHSLNQIREQIVDYTREVKNGSN